MSKIAGASSDALCKAIPEIGSQGTRPLASLRELRPTLMALTRNQTTQEFKEGGLSSGGTDWCARRATDR